MREETFIRQQSYEGIFFKHARGNLNIRGKEIHPFYELLLFKNGAVSFVTEDYKIPLKAPSMVIIPKASFHQFIVKDESEYERYVFNFPELPFLAAYMEPLFDKVDIIENVDPLALTLIEELCRNMKHRPENGELLRAVLTIVLMRLSEALPNHGHAKIKSCKREADDIITRVLKYIEKHYLENPSIENIAEKMFISPSGLSHLFRREMGISVHRFITEKRLIHAHTLLESGISPSDAAWQCGFCEYSTFYRSYRSFFGKAPATEHREKNA